MIQFFQGNSKIFAVQANQQPIEADAEKLCWLFGKAQLFDQKQIDGWFKGPRKEMVSPWSTNAVEITRNMGIEGIVRIEEFIRVDGPDSDYDPMLESLVHNPGQDLFKINREPDPIIQINDIDEYNEKEGLALSRDEVDYLNDVSKR